jgi:muramoyltetrapeptide carboxypeptidase
MDIPIILPPRLKKGDCVGIVAPAGPVGEKDALDRSVAAIERMGFHVRYADRIFQSSRYLAGGDAERAEELMRAFEDDSIRAVIGLRGGYGCARLIPRLDGNRMRNNPKLFMGFSDLTTLHLFFYRHFGWITLHGPMAVNPGLGAYTADQESHLISLWTDPGYRPALTFSRLETWSPGTAQGPLVGGCLSNIVASIGTPYEIDTDGKVLFLEDVGEPPYRLDRMLTHLDLAGKLRSLTGILLGDFHECDATLGSDYSAQDVLRDLLEPLKIPVLANFPSGHGPENWALTLGAGVRIDAGARRVEFLNPAVQ